MAFSGCLIAVGNRWLVLLPPDCVNRINEVQGEGWRVLRSDFLCGDDAGDKGQHRVQFQWRSITFSKSAKAVILHLNANQRDRLRTAGKEPLPIDSWSGDPRPTINLWLFGTDTTPGEMKDCRYVVVELERCNNLSQRFHDSPEAFYARTSDKDHLPDDVVFGPAFAADMGLKQYVISGIASGTVEGNTIGILRLRPLALDIAEQLNARKSLNAKVGPCHWCGKIRDLTDDHVPPKGLFPARLRSKLKIVRACAECNNGWQLASEYMKELLAIVLLGDVVNTDLEEVRQEVLRAIRKRVERGLSPSLVRQHFLGKDGWQKVEPAKDEPDFEKVGDVISRISHVLFSEEFGYYVIGPGGSSAACSHLHTTSTKYARALELLKERGKSLAGGLFKYYFEPEKLSDTTDSEWLMSFYDQAVFTCRITSGHEDVPEFKMLGMRYAGNTRELLPLLVAARTTTVPEATTDLQGQSHSEDL